MKAGYRYYDSGVFASELEGTISTSWHIAGHCSEWSRVGDFKLVCVGTEEIILIRLPEGFSAIVNVCAHRGSRIVTRPAGNLGRLVCPYHSWSYCLSGELLDSRGFCETNTKGIQLASAPVKQKFGFVLVSLRDTAQSLDTAVSGLATTLSTFNLDMLRLESARKYLVDCNWKVFVANFLECYHCFSNHPQLRESEKFIADIERGRTFEVMRDTGSALDKLLKAGVVVQPIRLNPHCSVFTTLNIGTLNDGKQTETRSGKFVGRMLKRGTAYDGVIIYGCIGPFIHFTLNPDHLVVFSFNPISATQTQVVVSWYVHSDSNLKHEQRKDMLWLWSHTIRQDIQLTERVQSAARSLYFPHSRISRMEEDTGLFEQWCKVHEELGK